MEGGVVCLQCLCKNTVIWIEPILLNITDPRRHFVLYLPQGQIPDFPVTSAMKTIEVFFTN